MYVCVCNAVTRKDIEVAIAEGANCLEHLCERLDVSLCCGACAEAVNACLEEGLPGKADR